MNDLINPLVYNSKFMNMKYDKNNVYTMLFCGLIGLFIFAIIYGSVLLIDKFVIIRTVYDMASINNNYTNICHIDSPTYNFNINMCTLFMIIGPLFILIGFILIFIGSKYIKRWCYPEEIIYD